MLATPADQPLPWALELHDPMKTDPHPGAVHWITGTGVRDRDQQLAWLHAQHPEETVVIPGQSNDVVAHVAQFALSNQRRMPRVVIIDTPLLLQPEALDWSGIQHIKDAFGTWVGKSQMVKFGGKRPHIFIFSEWEEPPWCNLIAWKWRVLRYKPDECPTLVDATPSPTFLAHFGRGGWAQHTDQLSGFSQEESGVVAGVQHGV